MARSHRSIRVLPGSYHLGYGDLNLFINYSLINVDMVLVHILVFAVTYHKILL